MKKTIWVLSILTLFNNVYANEISGGDVTLGDLKTAIYYLLKDTKKNQNLIKELSKNTNDKFIETNTKIDLNKKELDKNITSNKNLINSKYSSLRADIDNLRKEMNQKFAKKEREIVFVHNEVQSLKKQITSNIKLLKALQKTVNNLNLKNGESEKIELSTPYDKLLKDYISKKEKTQTIKKIEEKFNQNKNILEIKFKKFKKESK